MSELSVFVDESGDQGGQSRYYGVALVFHDQEDDISPELARYRLGLADAGLPDVPLHAGPLLNGHDLYSGMPMATRKRLLSAFFLLLRRLPVRYYSLLYRRSELPGAGALSERMARDLSAALLDRLGILQSYDRVKVYYDDGQEVVAAAVRDAFASVVSTGAVEFRRSDPGRYALEQAADLLCTLELTAEKFRRGEQTRTDVKVFGSASDFRRNYMKQARRKRL